MIAINECLFKNGSTLSPVYRRNDADAINLFTLVAQDSPQKPERLDAEISALIVHSIAPLRQPIDLIPYSSEFDKLYKKVVSEFDINQIVSGIACDSPKHGLWLRCINLRKNGGLIRQYALKSRADQLKEVRCNPPNYCKKHLATQLIFRGPAGTACRIRTSSGRPELATTNW